MIYPEWIFKDSSVGKIPSVKKNEIKFKLQILKTKAKRWGVRSKDATPSGSVICEYLGEIIEDEKALKEVDNDECLFNIGNNIHKDYSGFLYC